MSYRIVIATNLAEDGLHLLRSEVGGLARIVEPDQLLESPHLKTAEALIIRDEVIVDETLLDKAPDLRVIGRIGVDIATIDIEAATRRGIIVMNTPGANAISIAEYAIALMLNLNRQIVAAHTDLAARQWNRDQYIGSELHGKTLGIIGLGRVGREVARRAMAFNMNILAVDPFISENQIEGLHVKLVGLNELLENADIITIHTATTAQTAGIINEETLTLVRPGVLLINVAHGSLMDEQAVHAMLESGRVAGVGVDVFSEEPNTTGPLINHPQVIHTPHIGDNTHEARRLMATTMANQILDALRGKDYQNAINLPFLDNQPYESIAPYLKLAERIGLLGQHLIDGNIQRIMIEFRGEEYIDVVKPVTVALLKGVLTPVLGDQVNYINAPVLANEQRIFVTQTKGLQVINYKNLISCQFDQDGGDSLVIAGALFNHTDPHIVQINQYRTDFRPEGVTVIMGSYDVPGVIGKIGKIMADNNINIASWHTGRAEPGGNTLSILTLDDPMPESLLDTLREQEYIRHARQIIM